MRKIPVIMDCDPGHDDAIALIMAFASEKLEVRAVTTSAGNQTPEKTLNNALRVLDYIGVEVPVAQGAKRPLLRELEVAPEVHGESGLEGPEIPDATSKPVDMPAIDLMRKVIMESEEKITLIPTGPLTNIAMLLLAYPEVKDKIEQISLMGGAAYGGNWTPAAEFNILVDPEAAKIVYDSGLPIIMAGLDVTHKAIISKPEVEIIRDLNTKVGIFVAELLDFFVKFHDEVWKLDGCPLHDPCAVAYLIAPEIFEYEQYAVDIETQGEFTTGMTVVDFNRQTGRDENVKVLMGVDRQKFVDLLVDLVSQYK
jgi:pyrimidine-specific ribonucleoside hydrolase